MHSWTSALLLCALFSACHCAAPSAPAGADAAAHLADAGLAEKAGPRSKAGGPVETLPQCADGDGDFLQRAQFFYDSARYLDALACAVQASGAEPNSPDAHCERAWALVGLQRFEEARAAYARALALDPDHRDALQGAGELYITKLPFSREYSELGLTYALHGHDLASRAADAELSGRFASVAATALNDLGRAREALALATEALAAGVDVDNARYEKASALWELCRFDEAKAEFEALQLVEGREAHAHHYLGLIAERHKDAATAEREVAKAQEARSGRVPASGAHQPRGVRPARHGQGRRAAAGHARRSPEHPGFHAGHPGHRGPRRQRPAALSDDRRAVPRAVAGRGLPGRREPLPVHRAVPQEHRPDCGRPRRARAAGRGDVAPRDRPPARRGRHPARGPRSGVTGVSLGVAGDWRCRPPRWIGRFVASKEE
ncbi:MAG: tetratricopeptide repeat protein [Myxococcales bacterium]